MFPRRRYGNVVRLHRGMAQVRYPRLRRSSDQLHLAHHLRLCVVFFFEDRAQLPAPSAGADRHAASHRPLVGSFKLTKLDAERPQSICRARIRGHECR